MPQIFHKDWDINEHATGRFYTDPDTKKVSPIMGATFQNGLNDKNANGTFSPCDDGVSKVIQGVTHLKMNRGRMGELRFGDSSHPNSFLVKIKKKNFKGVSFKYTGATGSSMSANNGKPLCHFDNGISIESTPYYKGVKMDIIVNDPLTAPTEYPFSIKTYGQNYTFIEENGGATLRGEDQEPIFIKPPYAEDANGDIGPVTIHYTGMVGNLITFRKVVDGAWLRQAAAPVRIDPDVTIDDDSGILVDTAFSNFGVQIDYNYGASAAGGTHQTAPTNQAVSWLKVDLSAYSGLSVVSSHWGLDLYNVSSPRTLYGHNCLRDIIEGVSTGAGVNAGEPTWNNYSHPSSAWTTGGARGSGDRDLTEDNTLYVDSTGTKLFPISPALTESWIDDFNYGEFIDTVDAGGFILWRSSEATLGNKPFFYMEYIEDGFALGHRGMAGGFNQLTGGMQ